MRVVGQSVAAIKALSCSFVDVDLSKDGGFGSMPKVALTASI